MAKSETFVRRSIAFGRALRRAGLNTTMGQVMDFVRSVEHLDISQREIFREAGRACLVTNKDDNPTFDRVFDSYWRAKFEFADDFFNGAQTSDDTLEAADGEGDEQEGEDQAAQVEWS